MKFFKVLAVLLLVLLAILGVIYFLATSDPNKDKYIVEPSSALMSKAFDSSVQDKEVELTSDELNCFFAYVLQKYNNSNDIKDQNLILKNIYINLCEEEKRANIYARCSYKGVDLGVTMNTLIEFNNENKTFNIKIEKMKIGKLSAPVEFCLKKVSSRLPDFIKADKDNLIIDVSSIYTDNQNFNTPISIESFKIKNMKAYLKMTPLKNLVNSYITGGIEQGKEYLKGLLKSID